jgi:lipid-A-disaccharide synthase
MERKPNQRVKRDFDKLFVILLFEKDFEVKHDLKWDFVGHPLIDAIHHRENNRKGFQKEKQS